MSATDGSNNSGLFGTPLSIILYILAIAVVAITIERVITIYLSRVAKRAKLERNVTNSLVLTFRIIILIGAVLVISNLGGLKPEWILSISAIAGAALGFASQKTLGNFLAGLFLLASRPFKVGDYVRLGTVEGVVQEVTINYTKVLTISNNTVSVSNLQILDRDITNFSQGNVYCYTFEVGFDHPLSPEKIAEVFHAVFEKYRPEVPRMPTY